MTQKEKLFQTMVKAMRENNEKELQYLITKRERDAAIKAYKEYDEVENCQNLTAAQVGEGSKTAEIYCGDEYYAEFLIDALGKLGIKAECEIFTIDGEYHVEVKM